MNGRTFLDLLMFNSQQGCQSSLNELAEDFEIEHGKTISKQGLDERFNAQAVNFLAQVLSKTLQSTLSTHRLIDTDTIKGCYLRDSTRYGLPDRYADKYKGHGGATKTQSMISIQYEMDLLSGQQVDLQLTSGARNDQQDSKDSSTHIPAGTLSIRDLGYITSSYLKTVISQEAFFLNRLPSQMNIYQVDGEQICFKKLYKKMKRHQLDYVELEVLAGKKARIPCRVIVYLTDEKTASHRLKKTTKNTKSIGCQVSENQKIRTKLDIYMTNVAVQVIEAKKVKSVYSLRWQIELVFKTWKSIGQIDKVKNVKIHRFECMLLAGLIWIMTNWKFFQCINGWYTENFKDKTCSLWKFFKQAARHKSALRDVIAGKKNIENLLETLLSLARTKLFKETKKGQEPYLQTLKILT